MFFTSGTGGFFQPPQDFRQQAVAASPAFARTFATAEARQHYEDLWREMIDGTLQSLPELRTEEAAGMGGKRRKMDWGTIFKMGGWSVMGIFNQHDYIWIILDIYIYII